MHIWEHIIHKKLLVISLAGLLLLTGCSKEETLTVTSEEPQVTSEDAFGQQNVQNTETLAEIGHGLLDPEVNEDGTVKALNYKGGEMEIPYELHFSGSVPYFGLLIYVDGIPQPYKIKGEQDDSQYIHEMELKDGEKKDITLAFTPVTGKKGDVLELTIASIFYPSFIPDLKETMAYGNYHNIVSNTFQLDYQADSEESEENKIEEKKYFKGVGISEEKQSLKQLEKYGCDKELVNSQYFADMYINGELKDSSGSYDFKKGEILHITYKVYGMPDYQCTNIACINHEPVYGDDGCLNAITLKRGKTTVIEMDLDTDKLDDFSTFYMVTVPRNSKDYPDNVLDMSKTCSVLLHREGA